MLLLDRPPTTITRVSGPDAPAARVDGLDVLRRLRAKPRTALVPVVILTSSKEDRDRASGYQSGANSYVQKPVDFTSFVDAVRQLGMYWLMLNEPPPNQPS